MQWTVFSENFKEKDDQMEMVFVHRLWKTYSTLNTKFLHDALQHT